MDNIVKGKINRSKQSITENTCENVRKSIKSLSNYIKLLKSEYKDACAADIENHLNVINSVLVDKIACPSSSDLHLHNTIKYVNENPEIIEKRLVKMDRIPKDKKANYLYGFNIDENITTLLQDFLGTMTEGMSLKEKVKLDKWDYTEDEKNEFISHILKFINDYDKETYTPMIVKGYQDRVMYLAQFLDDYGTLEETTNRNNSILKNVNLDILGFEYESSKKNKTCVKDLTDKKYLEKLSIDELVAISSFLCNRFSKICKSMNESMFILQKKQEIEKIVNNKNYNVNVSDSEIKELLAQRRFIANYAKDDIANKAKYIKQNNLSYDEQDDVVDSLNTPNALKNLEKEYIEYCAEKNLPKDSLDDDYKSVMVQELSNRNLYTFKDFAMKSMIAYLLQNGTNLNWGYIEETFHGNNSIQCKNPFVLIGVDFKGYNLPIRLHIKLSDLRKIMAQYNGTSTFPVYEGYTDMILKSKYVSTQILMPMQKYQKKYLKEYIKKAKPEDQNLKFIQHLNWMAEPTNYTEFVSKKGVSSNFRRMVDLQTGKINLAPRKKIAGRTQEVTQDI